MTLDKIKEKYGVAQADASDKKADGLKLFEQRKKAALQLAKKVEGKIGKFSSQPYPYPAAGSLGLVVEPLQEIDRTLG